MQYACAVGKTKSVRFLLEKGASTSIKDKTGRNALEIAIFLKKEEVVGLFKLFQNKEIQQKVTPQNSQQLENLTKLESEKQEKTQIELKKLQNEVQILKEKEKARN